LTIVIKSLPYNKLLWLGGTWQYHHSIPPNEEYGNSIAMYTNKQNR
jgi:hypothetical protein